MDYRDIIDNLDFETDFLERINDNIMLTKKEIEFWRKMTEKL